MMTARSTGLPPCLSVPMMWAELGIASWETIMRRSMLMATNCCSPNEYHRMMEEKATAMMQTGQRLFATGGMASIESLLEPWHGPAIRNAKRLRHAG